MAHLSPEDVLIRMWRTPNPYALKFTLNVPLKQTGKATFHAPEEAPNLPLVQSLFSIPGIKRVYLFQNQMTLTHDGQISEKEMEEQVTAIVHTRIQVHDPNFMEEQKASVKTVKRSDDPIISQIDEILDRTVRPGLQADGGDLEVLSVENNQVKIAYQGACGGCPSAMTGTLEAIENILQHEMNKPDLTVIPV